MKIYLISNVAYPEEKRLHPEPEDLLVFLNTARSAGYYRDHKKKCVYHRSENRVYGDPVPDMPNYYLWGDGGRNTLPKHYRDETDARYDWDYPIEPDQRRSATTGFYVAEFLRARYGLESVILVNFGYEVKNSTHRCPFHNWKFEAERLKEYTHIFTCEVTTK